MTFDNQYRKIAYDFITKGVKIHPKNWQAIESPMPTYELLNAHITYQTHSQVGDLAEDVKPNLPWADSHFLERIGGEPLNPGETYKIWPFYRMDKDMRREGDKFSHTYMERFWPKLAGKGLGDDRPNYGIRYQYGDLQDLVMQLLDDPLTRQAYLPIFFPEDTGNRMKQRVPCTLGYQFILRDGKLYINYYMRSCDFMRHFRDDVYLACRLLISILNVLKIRDQENWGNVTPGPLNMYMTSLHIFESDMYSLKKLLKWEE